MNYIQYIDNTYTVKVKEITGEGESHFLGRRYLIEGIDTEFFVLSVFIEDKRRDGFEYYNEHPDTAYHTDNLFMKSIVNDLGMIDLNMIPLNYFLQANKKVMFVCDQSTSFAQSVTVLNQIAPLPYLHKYKNPKLLDITQYSGNYNQYIVVFRSKFDSSVSNTEVRVDSNDTFHNENKSAFSNLSYPDGINYAFADYVRFMDMYVKFEPKIANIPVIDSKKICWFEIRLDSRTNEFTLNHWYNSLADINPAHPSGYYLVRQHNAVPISGGMVLDTTYYTITIKFDM